MPMYRDTALTLDRQHRSRLSRAEGEWKAAPESRDDGTLIFCGISIALFVVALWVSASGHGDMTAMMF